MFHWLVNWRRKYGRYPNNVNIQFSATLRHGQKTAIPTLKKSSSQCNQTLYDNSFEVIGPRLWNLIPSNMHTIEDPLHLKEMLTTFVKSFPDEPPVAGYSCRNGNSLYYYWIRVEWRQHIHSDPTIITELCSMPKSRLIWILKHLTVLKMIMVAFLVELTRFT